LKLLIFKTKTCHFLLCSLGLVVLSKEINGLDEAALSDELDIGVLTDPVSKVELEVGFSVPDIWSEAVTIPIEASGRGERRGWLGSDVTWDNEVRVSRDIVKDGNLGGQVVDVVVNLSISDGETVTSINESGHLLTL